MPLLLWDTAYPGKVSEAHRMRALRMRALRGCARATADAY